MSDTTPTPPPAEGSGAPTPPTQSTTGPSTGQPGYGPPPTGQPGYGPPPTGQPVGQPGYGPTPTPNGDPADLVMRFLARLIDLIIVGVVVAIIQGVLLAGVLGLSMGGYGGFSVGGSILSGIIGSVISAALYLGYFAVMESRNGQTVGKLLLKLQTQAPDGSTPTMEQALRRNAWTALGVLGVVPIIGGLVGGLAELVAVIMIAVTISQSPIREGWHDRFAGGTKVIKIG